MHSLFMPADPRRIAPTRMVWLPGAFQKPEDFVTAGFVAAARRRGVALDLEFVALELDHVGDRSTLDRLAREVVAPARTAGCRSVWLAGISLGGFFALDYASRHAADCDGLCLLAPYLGNRGLIAEITAVGLAAWDAGALAQSDEERRIWHFLKQGAGRLPAGAPLLLGYGHEDRFARAHALLAAALPAAAVRRIDGGHDWPTWLALWEYWLESEVFHAE